MLKLESLHLVFFKSNQSFHNLSDLWQLILSVLNWCFVTVLIISLWLLHVAVLNFVIAFTNFLFLFFVSLLNFDFVVQEEKAQLILNFIFAAFICGDAASGGHGKLVCLSHPCHFSCNVEELWQTWPRSVQGFHQSYPGVSNGCRDIPDCVSLYGSVASVLEVNKTLLFFFWKRNKFCYVEEQIPEYLLFSSFLKIYSLIVVNTIILSSTSFFSLPTSPNSPLLQFCNFL